MFELCQEYGEIIAIVPIPAGQCQFDVPFNIESPSVSASSVMLSAVGIPSSPGYAEATHPSAPALFMRSGFFVDGYDARASASTIISIRPKPSVKGTAKRGLDGSSYSVKVTASTEEAPDVVSAFVRAITHHECFHLFLVDTNNQCYLVRGVFPATSMQYNMQLPVYNLGEVSFELHCVNGIQPIY